MEESIPSGEGQTQLLEALKEMDEEVEKGAAAFSLSTKNLQLLKASPESPLVQVQSPRLPLLATPSKAEDDSEVSQSPFKAPGGITTKQVQKAEEEEAVAGGTKAEEGGIKTEPKEEVVSSPKQSSSSNNTPHKKSSSSSHRHHRPRRANVRIQCRIDRHQKAPGATSSTARRGFCMANPCPTLAGHPKYKYGHLMSVETYPNGGAKILHMWQEDLEGIGEEELEEVAKEFLEVRLHYRSIVLEQ